MLQLRGLQPEWQVGFTCFSPSAAALLAKLPADVTGYLPYDRVHDVTEFLDLLAPSALIFTKLDLWPELATRAHQRGVKLGLITGTVRPHSGRLRWPIRALLHPGYAVLDAVGTASEDDGDRLVQLGVERDRIQMLGDPRYDSVATTVAEVAPEDPIVALGEGAWTIVAGSTWRSDDQVLLSAFRAVRRERPDPRLILVPHEPSSRQLHRIERTAAQLGLPGPVLVGGLREPRATHGRGPIGAPGPVVRGRQGGPRRRRVWRGRASFGAGALGLGNSRDRGTPLA